MCHFSAAAVFVLLRVSWDNTECFLWSSFCASRTGFSPCSSVLVSDPFSFLSLQEATRSVRTAFHFPLVARVQGAPDSCSSFLGSARPLRLTRDFPGPSFCRPDSARLIIFLPGRWHPALERRPMASFFGAVFLRAGLLRFPAHGLGSCSALPPIWPRFRSSPTSISYAALSLFRLLIYMILPPLVSFC
jgi:hypothetical protein